MRKAFTLIEVMISVMIVSFVIGVLLQLYANNTSLFASMRNHSELAIQASLLVGNSEYGFEEKKITLAELVQTFEVDESLRQKLKSHRVSIGYKAYDFGQKTQASQKNALSAGHTSMETKGYKTTFLRLKFQ